MRILSSLRARVHRFGVLCFGPQTPQNIRGRASAKPTGKSSRFEGGLGFGVHMCVCVCVSVRFSSHVPVFGRAVRVLDFRGGVQGLRSIWFRALNKTQVFSV